MATPPTQRRHGPSRSGNDIRDAPLLDVVVEIPRWSFIKWGSTGHVDFVSPFPCPFNYGSVPMYLGLEGDLLDAVILGPRLPRGTRVRVRAFGAIGLTERGMYDDKLICSTQAPGPAQRRMVLAFFWFYVRCKRLLNLYRARPGHTACGGWRDARAALARARPRPKSWRGPRVPF